MRLKIAPSFLCSWMIKSLKLSVTDHWSFLQVLHVNKNLSFGFIKLLIFPDFTYLLNPLRALWHIRPTQEIANHPCFAPSVQPGPKIIHSPSFLARMIFSMSPLIFLVCVCLHLVSILRWFETVFHFPFQLKFMKGLLVCSKRLLLLVDSRCCNNLSSYQLLYCH